MDMISKWVGGVLRAVVKLTLLAFGLVVMLGLLMLAAAGLLVALLRYVFTGRKPVAFRAFTQFRQFRQSSQFRRSGQPGYGAEPSAQAKRTGHMDGAHGVADVVDVQAYEVGTQPDRTNTKIIAPMPLIQRPKS